jgi:hypothetical protein
VLSHSPIVMLQEVHPDVEVEIFGYLKRYRCTRLMQINASCDVAYLMFFKMFQC